MLEALGWISMIMVFIAVGFSACASVTYKKTTTVEITKEAPSEDEEATNNKGGK